MLKPKVVEVMALRKAMTICWELGFIDVVFEENCLRVVTVANSINLAKDDLCLIISNVQHMILKAQGWSVQYSHWSTNRVTHNLAKLACNITSNYIWIEEYPPSIDDVIQLDKLCIAPDS